MNRKQKVVLLVGTVFACLGLFDPNPPPLDRLLPPLLGIALVTGVLMLVLRQKPENPE